MKTILFDLDDTLLDFHKSEAAAICETFRQLSLEPTPEIVARYSEINGQQWKLLEQGAITREQLLTRRFELLFAEQGIDCTGEAAQRIYEYQLSQQCHFIDDAVEILKLLSLMYDLYVVSNGTAVVQDSRMEISGLRKYFQNVFISQRMGYNKPSAAFFEQCFAQIPGFQREETIIVGDSLSSDIQGGNNAGIRTCWYNPTRQLQPEGITVDWEISRLQDLLQLPVITEDIQRICKPAVTVIGKEGFVESGSAVVQTLWSEANGAFAQVAPLAKKNVDGSLAGIWGAMTDASKCFHPWEDDFTRGWYLAGVECEDDAQPLERWSRWVLPASEYLQWAAKDESAFSKGLEALEQLGLPLAGAVQEWTRPLDGKTYLLYPIRRL